MFLQASGFGGRSAISMCRVYREPWWWCGAPLTKRIRNIEWMGKTSKKQKLLSDSVVGHRNDSANERKRGWRGAHKKLLYQINIIIRYKYKAPIYSTIEHREKKSDSKCMGWKHHRNITTHSPSLYARRLSVCVGVCLFLCSGTHQRPTEKSSVRQKHEHFVSNKIRRPPVAAFVWQIHSHVISSGCFERII